MEGLVWFLRYVIEAVKYLLLGHYLFGFAWNQKKSRFIPILYLALVPVIICLGLKEQFWLYLYVWIVVLIFCCFQAPTAELAKAVPFIYFLVCLADMALACIYVLGSGLDYNADRLLGIHMNDVFGIIVWGFIAIKGKYLQEKFQDYWRKLSLPMYLCLTVLLLFLGLVFGVITIYSEENLNGRIKYFTYGIGLLLLFLILGGTVWLLHIRQEKIRLEEKEQYLHSFVKLQTQMYQESIKKYDEMRQFRHDIAKHIFVMSEMCKSERFGEMKSYLAALQKNYDQILEIHTGNFLADCLVNQAVNDLKEQGELQVQVKGHFPEILEMDDTDFCILLGNALDNAREAIAKCGEKRYLALSVRWYKKNLYLSLQNSVTDSNVSVTKTSKKEKEKHGYGIQNMCHVVKKYHGDIQWEVIQKEILAFQGSITLMELKIRLSLEPPTAR